MERALVIGYGQIGQVIVQALHKEQTAVTLMTRTAAVAPPAGVRRIIADAMNPTDVDAAIEGHEVVFACFHAPYDSRRWAQTLPRMEGNVLASAAKHGAAVIFPESVYAFAGSEGPIHECSEFSPSEPKGRIRQQLIEARTAHEATALSIVAGDLIGHGTRADSSIIRALVTDRVTAGKRPLLLGAPDRRHALSAVDDLSSAMIAAGRQAESLAAQGRHVLVGPAQSPAHGEVASWAQQQSGAGQRRPLVIPQWTLETLGLANRSMKEIALLKNIWRRDNILVPSPELAALAGESRGWQHAINDMLPAVSADPSRAA